jgi:hypothetical protein
MHRQNGKAVLRYVTVSPKKIILATEVWLSVYFMIPLLCPQMIMYCACAAEVYMYAKCDLMLQPDAM